MAKINFKFDTTSEPTYIKYKIRRENDNVKSLINNSTYVRPTVLDANQINWNSTIDNVSINTYSNFINYIENLYNQYCTNSQLLENLIAEYESYTKGGITAITWEGFIDNMNVSVNNSGLGINSNEVKPITVKYSNGTKETIYYPNFIIGPENWYNAASGSINVYAQYGNVKSSTKLITINNENSIAEVNILGCWLLNDQILENNNKLNIFTHNGIEKSTKNDVITGNDESNQINYDDGDQYEITRLYDKYDIYDIIPELYVNPNDKLTLKLDFNKIINDNNEYGIYLDGVKPLLYDTGLNDDHDNYNENGYGIRIENMNNTFYKFYPNDPDENEKYIRCVYEHEDKTNKYKNLSTPLNNINYNYYLTFDFKEYYNKIKSEIKSGSLQIDNTTLHNIYNLNRCYYISNNDYIWNANGTGTNLRNTIYQINTLESNYQNYGIYKNNVDDNIVFLYNSETNTIESRFKTIINDKYYDSEEEAMSKQPWGVDYNIVKFTDENNNTKWVHIGYEGTKGNTINGPTSTFLDIKLYFKILCKIVDGGNNKHIIRSVPLVIHLNDRIIHKYIHRKDSNHVFPGAQGYIVDQSSFYVNSDINANNSTIVDATEWMNPKSVVHL